MENNKFFFDIVACNLVKVKPVTVSYGESFSTFFFVCFCKRIPKDWIHPEMFYVVTVTYECR